MHNYPSSLLKSLSLSVRTTAPSMLSRLLDRQHFRNARNTIEDGKAYLTLLIHRETSQTNVRLLTRFSHDATHGFVLPRRRNAMATAFSSSAWVYWNAHCRWRSDTFLCVIAAV